MFLKSETNSVLFCSLCTVNALPYIGKFDSQAAFGTYSLATTCAHKNMPPCCFEHKYGTHTVQCNYGCSTFMANLCLQPIYSYDQSAVAVKLWLQPIYGCCQCTVAANLRFTAHPWLQPIYGYGQSTVTATLFCYYSLSAHYSYSSAIFGLYALSECNF